MVTRWQMDTERALASIFKLQTVYTGEKSQVANRIGGDGLCLSVTKSFVLRTDAEIGS